MTTRELMRGGLAALEQTPSGRSAGPEGDRSDYPWIRARDWKPPQAVEANAEEGLALRAYNEEERGLKRPGGTEIGVARAVQLTSGRAITPRAARRMAAYFSRHQRDKQARGWGDLDKPTPGFVAWQLWGGDEGWAWANRLVAMMKQQHNPVGPSLAPEAARQLGQAIGIVWDEVAFPVDEFARGVVVELEHGTVDPRTDVTHDDAVETAKIAWAHLEELPDYYTRLDAMEADAEHNPAQLVGEAPWATEDDVSDAFEFWQAHEAVKSAAGHPIKAARFRVVNESNYDYLKHLEPGGVAYPEFGGLADDREDAIDFLAWSFDWDADDAEWLYDSYADNPIVVFVHGGKHMLADGFHRMEVAFGMGDPTIPATLFVVEDADANPGGGEYFGEAIDKMSLDDQRFVYKVTRDPGESFEDWLASLYRGPEAYRKGKQQRQFPWSQEANPAELASVRFVYYDLGELAQDLDQVVLTVGSKPEDLAYGIAWQYGPRNLHEYIESEADEEIDEVVALRVHNIEAQPGGLFGVDYGYDIEAWWVPWEEEEEEEGEENPLPPTAAFLAAADEALHADWSGRGFVGRDELVQDVLARLGLSECAFAADTAERALSAVAGEENP